MHDGQGRHTQQHNNNIFQLTGSVKEGEWVGGGGQLEGGLGGV